MTLIRIEPALDPATQRYGLAIYHPHDAPQPFVTTPPRYASAAAAETDLIAIIAAGGTAPSPPGRGSG